MNPEIIYTLHVEQDDIPVRGNALASGDDATDKRAEDEILDRLNRGDVWAWAYVEVRATLTQNGETFIGRAGLGGCSYADEADWRADNWASMCAEAREDLRSVLTMAAAEHRAVVARRVLKSFPHRAEVR